MQLTQNINLHQFTQTPYNIHHVKFNFCYYVASVHLLLGKTTKLGSVFLSDLILSYLANELQLRQDSIEEA